VGSADPGAEERHTKFNLQFQQSVAEMEALKREYRALSSYDRAIGVAATVAMKINNCRILDRKTSTIAGARASELGSAGRTKPNLQPRICSRRERLGLLRDQSLPYPRFPRFAISPIILIRRKSESHVSRDQYMGGPCTVLCRS
jgi:hypothetical protein